MKDSARRLLLPDFCAARAVLAVLLIVTLTALLLALASAGFRIGFWTDFVRNTFFLVWIGLGGAAALCMLRHVIARFTATAGAIIVLGVIVTLVALVSEVAYYIILSKYFNMGGLLGLMSTDHWLFLSRNVLMGLIVGGLALRYFYVAQQWRLNVESQALSRINALQARIRPHFLYNSMNTIASLTRTNPSQAEEAVQDLADLFRANLNEKRNLITLKEELESARIYQRIEQLRLGERLRVRWDVVELPMRALIPALTVQPLLENAINHGIETLPEGGEVTVEGHEDAGSILLRVRNPMPPDNPQSHSGHGIALNNIRERFELLYGSKGEIKFGREGDEFVVQLRFPAVDKVPDLAT